MLNPASVVVGRFQYENALENYANLDLLISSILRFQSSGEINVTSLFGPRFKLLNVFYSSPEYYTKWKYEEVTQQSEEVGTLAESNRVSPQWSVKRDDFFPYSDCPHCFWTGYFTSRAGFKRLERVGSSFLQAARQIESMKDSHDTVGLDGCKCKEPLYLLDDAMGVVQHHDAVSGTAKQHVANDYAKRVQAGIDRAAKAVSEKLKHILLSESNAGQYLNDLSYCQLLNETKCEVSTQSSGKDLYVLVYNGLGQKRPAIVSLPIPADAAQVASQAFKIEHIGSEANVVEAGLQLQADNTAVLHFNTGRLPPVGGSVFRVSVIGNESPHDETLVSSSVKRTLSTIQKSGNSIRFSKDAAEVSNGILSVRFDR